MRRSTAPAPLGDVRVLDLVLVLVLVFVFVFVFVFAVSTVFSTGRTAQGSLMKFLVSAASVLASLAPALILLAEAAPAQTSRNVQLLGTFTKYVGRTHNDIWAFTAKDGKEYCLLGVAHGISYLDCSNPAAPQELAFYPGGGSSTWRDIKVYGGYAYCVTERRGEGMMIIDLRKPAAPRFVKFWTTSPDYRNCHNIGMDFERGHAWICGTSRGSICLDVATDPENPRELGVISSPYLHDLTIQDGLLHGADIYSNDYRIFDVQDPKAIQLLGRAPAPGSRYFHNCWPTRDNQIVLGTNEAPNGPVSIYDVSQPTQPTLIATYRANPSTAPNAIPHNAHVRDRLGHISYYTEGYRCLDVSDPSKPVEVGYYDTYSGSSSGYNGNWGAIPALDSGNVYLNDISSGLFIVRPRAATRYYGAPTPDGSGRAPQIGAFGSAHLGNARFSLDLWDAAPNSVAICVLGGQQGSLNLSGLRVHVELVSPAPLLLVRPTDQTGGAMQALPIPTDTGLTNLRLHAQWLVLDASSSSSFGFTGTQGAQFEVFAR